MSLIDIKIPDKLLINFCRALLYTSISVFPLFYTYALLAELGHTRCNYFINGGFPLIHKPPPPVQSGGLESARTCTFRTTRARRERSNQLSRDLAHLNISDINLYWIVLFYFTGSDK